MKKLLALLLIGATAVTMTACGGSGSGKSVTLTKVNGDDESISASVTVGYQEGTVVDEDFTEYEEEAKLVNEEKDFSVEMYLFYDNEYEDYKWAASSGDGYKEIKYSGCEGYMYDYDDYEYELCLKLADEGEEQVYLFAYIAPASDLVDTETVDIEAIFSQKEVQDILNSVKYKGTEKVAD